MLSGWVREPPHVGGYNAPPNPSPETPWVVLETGGGRAYSNRLPMLFRFNQIRALAGLTLLDETGHRVAGLLSRADRADLPLIAGEGADVATPEALQLIAAAGPLTPRLRGLVRIGERRWDLVLDRDQRVLLPEKNPVQALERLLALDHAQDLMNRDILAVDLRSDHRPTLRLTPNALAEIRRAQGLETVENEL